MKSGEKHRCTGFERQIADIINAGRLGNKLVRLELDRIPTGQFVAVDPNEVESVKGDRW